MKSYTSGFPQTASTSRHAAPKQFISQFLNDFINSKLKDVVPALFTLTHGEHSSKNTSFSHLQIRRAHPLPIQKPGGKIILVSNSSAWLQPYTELFLQKYVSEQSWAEKWEYKNTVKQKTTLRLLIQGSGWSSESADNNWTNYISR